MPDNPFDYAEQFNPRRLSGQQEGVRPVADLVGAEIDRMREEEMRLHFDLMPSPDKAARVSRLAREADVPAVYVEDDPDDVERAVQTGKFINVARQHPAIGRWAVQNPRGAAAAQDDHESLGVLGTAWDFLKNVPGRFADTGGWQLGGMLADTFNSLVELKDIALSPINAGIDALGQATGIDALDVQHYLDRQAQQRVQAHSFFQHKADMSRRSFQGSNAISEGLLQGIETAPLTVGAIATRSPEAAATVMGSLVGGQSYAQAREKGLDPATALSYGATQGAIEGITEKIPAGTLVDMIAKKVPFGKAFVRELGQEMTGEQLATALQDLTDWAYLPENKTKTFGDYLKARPEAAFNTALAVAGGTSATTIGIHATQRAAERTLQLGQRIADARQAGLERQFIDKAGKAAESSKLRQRDPESFRELVRHQAEETGASSVFVPGEAVRQYRQSDGYDEGSDPFTRWNVDEAAAAGGDVVIPIEDYLTDIVGTQAWEAVKQDVRLTPGGMSSREAETFESEMAEVMAKLSDEAAARNKADATERTAREKLVNKLATMFGESFTAPVARQYAELEVQRAQTRASRLGVDLTGNEFDDLEVRQVMPETVSQAVKADRLDLVINAMRNRGDAEIGKGPSLLDWVKKRGGINDTGGDLKALGVPKGIARAFDPQGSLGGITGAGDYGLDTTLRAAISEGYFPELTHLEQEHGPSQLDTNVLLDAIASELAGNKRHTETRTDPMRAAADDLRAMLESAGHSPDAMSDADIRDAVEKMDREGAKGGLEQANASPVVSLSGNEVAAAKTPIKELRAAAFKWFADHLAGQTAKTSDGREVRFSKRGGRKTITAKGERLLRAVPAIRTILEQGQVVHEEPSDRKGIARIQWIAAPVEVGNTTQTLAVMVREHQDGWLQYDFTDASFPGAGPKADGAQESGPAKEGAPGTLNQIDEPGDKINLTVWRAAETGPRGRVIFDQNKRIIELFQSRNLSTPLHEFSHMWLEELRFDASLPDAPEQLKTDWETVKRHFAQSGHPLGEDGQIPTEAHELFARSGERYLMEGKAPSSALTRLFETFRAWLTQIYRTVDRLKAPISPEMREVFDRLLATDDEINQARERQNIAALFKDAASAGMSEPEFNAYQKQVDEARSDANAKLLEKTMRAIRRRETERYRDARKDVRQENQDRIDAAPLFKSLRLLKDQRISKQWIEDEFGTDALALLPVRIPPIYADGGVHPDVVAEQAGYGGGKDMIEALIGAERAHRQAREGGDKRPMRERAIETATDEEMNRRYGDPLNDGSIDREALDAVHNDMQGEVIAAELRVLSRKTGQRPTPYALAKEWARGKIRGGVVAEEASPGAIQRYARNAAKAGHEAEAAMLKGDAEETFRQKQFQMLNNALLSEAKAAADEVDAAVKRMDKIARAKTRKSVDQDYLEQAQALLESVDLRQRSQVGIDRQGKWEAWAAAREAEGFDIVVPASFEATIGKTNWSRLSVENLLALDEAVKQIIHLGRLKQTLTDNQEQREWDAVIGEAEAQADNSGRKPPKGSFTEPGFFDSVRSRVATIDAALLKMEQVFDWLDGGNSNGVFNRVVFRPMADAQAHEQDMTRDYFGRIREVLQGVPEKTLRHWGDKITLDLIDPATGLPAVFERKKLVAMALNWGNAGNRQRLADGYGWSPAGIEQALTGNMTAEEWQFVQNVWDIIDTLWPKIEAMERSINGVAPGKVEAAEVITPFGTFRGGYYPVIYDATLDYTAEEQAGRKTDLFEASYIRASTRASATKERAEKVSRPILLDIGVINRHLGEVIHDVTHREAVMRAHRFLTNRRVMKAVDETLGPEVRKQFRPWLKHIANSWAAERAGNEGIGKFLTKARANATVVGMGFRFTTMLTQIAGYSNSAELVGAGWMTKAIVQTSAKPIDTFDFVMQRSGEMRNRLDTLDRDIRLAIKQMAGKENPLTAAKRFAFHGIGYMDRVVTVPTWIAAYNKALSQGMSEEDASYAGDKAVRLSQGAGGAKDLAAVATGQGRFGEAFKLLTMFYSYVSTVYSRQRNLGRDLRHSSARDIPALMARAWWLIVVPPLLAEILSGRGPDDDEEAGWWAFKKMLSQSLGAIPIVRDVWEPAWDKLAGNHGFDYRFTPVQAAGESAVRSAGDAGRITRGKDTKHATRDMLETAGYFTGLVPGQIAAAAQFLVDVGNGDADPETISDWYEGLTKGRIQED